MASPLGAYLCKASIAVLGTGGWHTSAGTDPGTPDLQDQERPFLHVSIDAARASPWKESWIQCLVESAVPTLCCWEGQGCVGRAIRFPDPWWAGWVAETQLTQWAASQLGG